MASSSAPSWADWRLDPPTAIPKESATLSHHPDLPRLPVPNLDQTVNKIIASVTPLAKDQNELNEVKRKLDAFVKSGQAEKLQNKLKERAQNEKLPSWLAEWWDTQGYMAYRDPVVLNVSYYYTFNRLPQSTSSTDPYTEEASPAFVAASLVSTILDFRALLLQGKIEPDVAGGQKLDMESYKWMFNACRIPAKPADYAIKLREDDPAGAHFIVIRNNRIYKLPLWSESNDKWSMQSLQRAFEDIYNEKAVDEPVGILTGVNRDVWTDARSYLLSSSSSSKNSTTLSAIESASFVLCLDPSNPSSNINTKTGTEDVIQFSRDAFHGNGQNRWYDKPLQWIVFDSGEAAFIGEHSCMDGTPTAKVNDYIGHRLSKRDFPTGGSESQLKSTYLPFELDDKSRKAISEATSSYSKAVSEQALDYLHYARYGKEGIKAQKCSPDGWVQMVMQLAYGLTFSDAPVTGTYEAAMTRKFALGRTETVRVCSSASKAFVLAMLDKSGKVTDQKKRKLFMDALAQHGKDMKDASNAQGIDRHIFGLKMINAEYPDVLEGKGKVELFEDDLFKRSGTWSLSTSLIYSKHFRGYGWGQVVPDGFGLPYSIHDNHLVWTVTSKKSQKTAEYTANLKKAADMLMDMSEHALLEQSQEGQNQKAKL